MANEGQKPLILEVIDSTEKRVDAWISEQLPDISRTKIKDAILRSKVKINSDCCKAKDQVSQGDIVEIEQSFFKDNEWKELKPISMPLDVLFEDEDILVINKPAGLTVHPGAGIKEPTLVHGLLAHIKDLEISFSSEPELKDRPGIVHRIDKDTSGLLVCAKNILAHRELAKQFAEKSNERLYLALLSGVPNSSNQPIESYLYRDPKIRTRFAWMSTKDYERMIASHAEESSRSYKFAKSYYASIVTFANELTLAAFTLDTGRTHQIRIHATQLECPIIGDKTYNLKQNFPGSFRPHLKEKLSNADRQLLHAHVLGFKHPRSGESMKFRSPLPKDFADICKMLEPYAQTTEPSFDWRSLYE